MTRRSSRVIGAATLCLALCASLGSAQEPTPATRTLSQEQLLRIATEVRGQMVALPQYGVFDNIHFWGQPRRHSCAPRGSTLRRHLQFTSAYRNTPLIADYDPRHPSPELRAGSPTILDRLSRHPHHRQKRQRQPDRRGEQRKRYGYCGHPGQWSSSSVQHRQPAPSGNPRANQAVPRHEFAHTSSARKTPESSPLLTAIFLPSQPGGSLASPGRLE